MEQATFGARNTLSSGILRLNLPSGSEYWYIQNQDTSPLLITFNTGSTFGAITLTGSPVKGEAGDFLDSIQFPWIGPYVVLTSDLASAQFGSGYSTSNP